MSYNVVYKYNESKGGYAGVIFWVGYSSKQEFEKFLTEDKKKDSDVVEQGISEERCIELTKQTPDICRLTAAVQDSIVAGTVNIELLRVHLRNAMNTIAACSD